MKSIILLTLLILGSIESSYSQSSNDSLLIDGGTLKVYGTFYQLAWDESPEIIHPFLWVCNEKRLSSLPIVDIETRLNSETFDLKKLPENSYSIEKGEFVLKNSFYNTFYEVELISKQFFDETEQVNDWTFEIVDLTAIDKMPDCFKNTPTELNFPVNIVSHGPAGETIAISFQEAGKPIITKYLDPQYYGSTILKMENLDTTTYGIHNVELTFERYNSAEYRNIPYNYELNTDALLIENGEVNNDVLDRFEDFILEFEKAVKSRNMERILQLSDLEGFKTHDAGIGPKELIEMEGWSQIEKALDSGVDEDYYEAKTRNDYPRLIFYKKERYENWKWIGIELD